ncbi:MAG: leucyl/phenylalanyl-tRNA--protein transferase [Mariprofundaceae bacterium]
MPMPPDKLATRRPPLFTPEGVRCDDFPDPHTAEPEGLVAIGGTLAPEMLMAAYRRGIFPWYGEGQPILWWSPDPRMVLFPGAFHCSRRLARRIRQGRYAFSRNRAFPRVIRRCASIPRRGENGTWILPEMITAYERLHGMGYAQSVEVWRGAELVGGLYGVRMGGVFFAESMFSEARDGSKMALAHLVHEAPAMGIVLIDCQFHTAHLASLGAREIPRDDFLQHLGALL